MNTSVPLITPTVNSNLLSITDWHTEPTMSSIEISELVQSRHDNVKRTMERLVDRELISITPMEEPPSNGGKPLTVYHVNERNSYVVVAQLSPEFSAVLVDEWRRLKNLVSLPDFNDPAIAARAWADEVEQKQRLQTKVHEDVPKVAYVNEVVSQGENLTSLADLGRIFKSEGMYTGARLIFTHLRQLNIIMRANVIPYNRYVEQGYFVIGQKTAGGRTYPVTFVTSRGQLWIHGKMKEAFEQANN